MLDDAQTVLQDAENVRWSREELLEWFNAAQRAVVEIRHDAYPVTDVVTLAAGTKQSIPAGGHALLNVLRNMGTDGATPGRAIRKVPRELLDVGTPDWHSATASTVTRHYTYDPLVPHQFFVYPPATGTADVELVYAATPAEVTDENDTITLDDVYANALLDYILYRAYSKDFELAGNAERADKHLSRFTSTLAMKSTADGAVLSRDMYKATS